MTNLALNLRRADTSLTFVQDGKVLTDSRTVAATFGKEHRNVLAAIKRLDIPEDFRELNFKPSTYKTANRNGQTLTCYHITRDGFTILVMGFTGKKAMEFKIKYIEAFNAMERALSAPKTDKPVLVAEHTRALPSGKREIVLSEKAKAEIGGIVKACLGTSKAGTPLGADALKQLIRDVLREELAGFLLKDGVKPSEAFNGKVTADGLPAANWALGIIHGASALQNIIGQLTDKQKEAVKLLA